MLVSGIFGHTRTRLNRQKMAGCARSQLNEQNRFKILTSKFNMNWESLLEKLKASVNHGEVTTYRALALWAFGNPQGTQAVVAMLNAAVANNFHNSLFTNRVIPESGVLADVNGQSSQLMNEGITIKKGKVVMSQIKIVRFDG